MATRTGFVSGAAVTHGLSKTSLSVSSFCGHRRAVCARPSRRVSLRMLATASAPTEEKSETFEFQAEVSRVMNLIINSLYSNKEIFLRELVSNAADACDKRRFLALSGGTAADDGDLSIYVKADKDAGTVTIEDGGVGMTRQELINNLGSIATSGTSKFLEALGEGKGDVSLIGQFGVGFYSAYLVAETVTVVTKSYTDPNAKQYRWESSASSSYTVSEDDSEPLRAGSGTRITLKVKEDSKEFLENFKLNELLKRYSEFISFPIFAWKERTEYDEVPDGDEKDEEGKPKMKRVPRTVEEFAQVNKLKPIWMRKPREVNKDEYDEFYKTIAKDYQDPVAYTHFAVEGDVEFRSILFCPKLLPMELRQNMFEEKGRMLKLYVKRVFISDSFEDILPRWLCFLRGVIDSEDLPLNVSREILQKSRVLRIISKRLVRKAIDMFGAIKARDNDDYPEFWRQFGRYIKAGIIEGEDNADALIRLSLWPSTNKKEGLTTLDEYVSRMKESQKDIYYVAATSRVAGESAPAMERLRKLGYEVLFLLEPVDEIAIQNIGSFKAKRKEEDKEETSFKFVDVAKDDIDFKEMKTEDEKKEDEDLAKDFKPVVDFLTTMLSEKVGKVAVSDRLTESASTIVQSSFGISPTMERYMKEVGAGGINDPSMSSFVTKARTLEINPKHPIIKDIRTRLEGAAGADDEATKQTCMLVYELALLTGGYELDDSNAFARRVSSLVSASVQAPEVIIPEPKPQEEKRNMADISSMEDALNKMQDEGITDTGDGENASTDVKSEDTPASGEEVKKVDTEVVE